MDLNELFIFSKVVQWGSFTRAARELDRPKSTVSRKIADLEERLGTRLLQRTTRKLSLTDAGRAYHEHCARIVAEIDEANRNVGHFQAAPRGRLRVTTPLNFGFMGPIVSDFLRHHPAVEIDIVCADRVVGLVEEGFDVAIRAGRLSDSTLVARRLARLSSFLVASPKYLKSRGLPRTPNDLRKHDGILFGAGASRGGWRLQRGAKSIAVTPRARLTVNDFDFLYEAAVEGLGVALIPVFRCANDLRLRRVQRVLPSWESPAASIQAVYPSQRHLSPTLRAFLDHVQMRMTPPPWEVGPVPQ